MWSSTVGLVNGKHRYLTAETFGFKVNSNGQQLKRRQQWTIEPFPENTGPDGSISSAASVSSSAQCGPIGSVSGQIVGLNTSGSSSNGAQFQPTFCSSPGEDPTCIMTLSNGNHTAGLTLRQSSGSNNGSDHSTNSCDEEHENVAIKSHLNKYLAVDSFGNVTCDSDEKSENARFTITICSMSQGKSKDEHIFWAFKNVERGYYLGTTEDGMICCNAKMPKSRAELWHLHLLPARGASFFALKSLGRKRFARVCNEMVIDGDHNQQSRAQVQLDANISWGPETLFQFKYYEGGRYALLTSDNMFLTNEGKCLPHVNPNETQQSSLPPNECLFTLEYHSGYLALRDSFGHYLAAAGRSSVLRSRSIGVSRDELFMFEGVPIQVSIKATFNNRWVSIKQGVDVSANQMETTSKYETFQFIYHKQTGLWSIMTQDCNFWTISKNTNTVCVCRPADYEALTRGQFRLIWSENDATFSLRYIDHSSVQSQTERWISARKSGQLYLSGIGSSPNLPSNQQEAVKFIMRFQNRRLLNLRPIEGNGYVGLKSLSSGPNVVSKQLEANKTSPDTLQIEYNDLELPISQTFPSASQSNNGDCNFVEMESNSSKVISVFNVKLNSTKKGQNMFEDQVEKINGDAKISQQHSQGDRKLSDFPIIDSNNNEEPEKQTSTLLQDQELVGSTVNGGVESGSAPSVASIINTFSNSVKITGTEQSSKASPQAAGLVPSLAVSKLASSFEPNVVQSQRESIHTITSGEEPPSNGCATSERSLLNAGKLADQVAQSECCYMRIVSNGKYLVVGPTNGCEIGIGNVSSCQTGSTTEHSVLCDATNKACAQTWILELRSHNSIAIRASDTQAYMQLGTNGTIYLSRCEPKQASLWEF